MFESIGRVLTGAAAGMAVTLLVVQALLFSANSAHAASSTEETNYFGPKLVQLGMIAGADRAPVGQIQWRLVRDRLQDEVRDVGQLVEPVVQRSQSRRLLRVEGECRSARSSCRS